MVALVLMEHTLRVVCGQGHWISMKQELRTQLVISVELKMEDPSGMDRVHQPHVVNHRKRFLWNA